MNTLPVLFSEKGAMDDDLFRYRQKRLLVPGLLILISK